MTTPMLQQYRAIKARYPDAILMFRLGDFYEMFNEDAEIASRVLEITLTSRETGKGNRMPMCGVPYHAAQAYIARLVDSGYKVAVCDQMEMPGPGRQIVRREVTRVVTPGTMTDPEFLDAKSNNYLAALAVRGRAIGLAVTDVSTGEFSITEAAGQRAQDVILAEVARLAPRECLIPPDAAKDVRLMEALRRLEGMALTQCDDIGASPAATTRAVEEQFGPTALESSGALEYPAGVQAAGVVLLYLQRTQMTSLAHMSVLRAYSCGDAMGLDPETRRSLEISDPIRERRRGRTLLDVLDRTVTSMGARLLRRWLDRPSQDIAEIDRRLDAVEELTKDVIARADLRRALAAVRDMERLATRVSTGTAGARDLVALAESFAAIPDAREVLGRARCEALRELAARLGDLSDVREIIVDAISDDPPAVLTEGGIIRDGYNEELDELRRTSARSREFLASLEATERERTGIKSLKVGYNQVFGYYIEVTRPNLHLVPKGWVRKQTLSGAERFITPELKEHEAIILKAKDHMSRLEYDLFCDVRAHVAHETARIQEAARALAEADVFASLAEVAASSGYVRPTVHEGGELEIVGARHPVVEATLPAGAFVPNDVRLDPDDCQIMVLTGPNMAGKSTLGKSVLLIVLMAHVGSFVPAASARIPLTDRIAVRAGSSEEIASGKSTFMVELLQTAAILAQATERTLIFIDELGRGTSTYDGMAIAQAVIEYLHNRVGAKTIFTTHFHELTELADRLPRVRNFRVEAEERGSEVVFLFRLVPGGCDKSYGINVARMAGMPGEVVRRASAILRELERRSPSRPQQMSLLAMLMDPGGEEAGGQQQTQGQGQGQGQTQALRQGWDVAACSTYKGRASSVCEEILTQLRALDINRMTPIEALQKLAELKARSEGNEDA
ncbi:MAG: DNA mismatch repair protein MutS [Firmicutes bacterium]|nr:DNA mismatch repair protein MutS [Bacillota bacterium]